MIKENQGEIVLYQSDEEVRIEVRLEEDTVWLTQAQMAELFQTSKQNVSLHTNNIFKEKELDRDAVVKDSLTTAADGKNYRVRYYNLDVIISVGYRVKSIRGTQFRQWANKVLKEYILKGGSVNRRLAELEYTVAEHARKIDFFVRTSLPPVEGVFYDGQVFDAYKFAADLIRTAKESLLLIDNYVDESVLMMLGKRGKGVSATICTQRLSRQLQLDLAKYDAQYPPIELRVCKNIHDRFLIIDNAEVYHIGASLKDLGKKMFAFSKLGIPAESLTSCLSDSK
ncbi:MAG: virulence RhuM family protein [Bacteroidetes bacterium]|uniref:Virulence RhuM family protein n=1 Tax=Candidatus Pullibacteroides excrementavium TaxID=2840905 RepID=A0A9D9GZ14_9BACT|nr:virulence RhuM family protein [Candidatus Pullibacteroides excrementavium]